MVRLSDPKLLGQIARKNHIDRLFLYTRTLFEITPFVQKVEVNMSIEFRTGELDHPVIKQYDEVSAPI